MMSLHAHVSPSGYFKSLEMDIDFMYHIEAEDKLYQNLAFKLDDIHSATESKTTIFDTEKEVLMAR